MGFERGGQERSYLNGCGTKRSNSLFCGQVRKAKLPVMQFVEGLLGAACPEPKTSSEKPAAWKCCMQDSMCADGTTSHLRCNLVETAGLKLREKPRLVHTQLD